MRFYIDDRITINKKKKRQYCLTTKIKLMDSSILPDAVFSCFRRHPLMHTSPLKLLRLTSFHASISKCRKISKLYPLIN